MPNFGSEIQKNAFLRRPVCLVGWLKPLIKSPIGHQKCQKCDGPCINMWHMIPSDRRKFEQETELKSMFRYFDDVIVPRKPECLKYSILLSQQCWPRYFGLNRYHNFSMVTIWWHPYHPRHPPNTPWHPPDLLGHPPNVPKIPQYTPKKHQNIPPISLTYPKNTLQ